jgi:murein peptide amidase A
VGGGISAEELLLSDVHFMSAASTSRDDATPRCIGTSRSGAPIQLRAFPLTNGRLLVFGGIHGDEPASVDAAEALSAMRMEAAAGPRAGHDADGDGRLWILPALNPDGLHAGRKNSASDVDLNRNFPARSFSRAHAPGYDPGPAPLSEPETAALARFIDEERVEAVVAIHAPFACVNFDGPAGDWAAAVSAASGWPVRPQIGYPTPGSLGSWLGIDRGIPILTLELPAGPLASFRGPASAALDRAVTYWEEGGTVDGARR